MPSDDPHPAGLPSGARPGSGEAAEDINARIREIRDQIHGRMAEDAEPGPPAGTDAAETVVEDAAPAAGAAADRSPGPEVAEAEVIEADAPKDERPKDDALKAEAAKPEPVPPPVAAAPRGGSGKGGVLGLIGGALAGGAVAGGMTYYFLLHPLAGPVPAPAPQAVSPAVDLAPVTAKLAALEARPAVDPAALAALGQRIEAAEAALKQFGGDLQAVKLAAPAANAGDAADAALAPVRHRLDGLEARLAGLDTAFAEQRTVLAEQAAALAELKLAAQKPPAPPEPPKQLLDSVAALGATAEATRGALTEVQTQVGGLRAAQGSLQSALTALGTTAANAEQGVQRLASRLDTAEKGVAEARLAGGLSRAATAAAVFSALREAVAGGRPFTSELDAAKVVLGPRASALDPLAAAAAAGFATPARLAQRLSEVGTAAVATLAPPEGAAEEGFVSRLMTSASHLVKVRPVDGIERASETGLGKAVALVRAGDLAGGLAEIGKLPPQLQEALKPVVAEIAARRAAVATVAALHQQALDAVAGKVP